MLLTLLFAGSAALLGYLLVATRTAPQVRGLLQRLTVAMAVVGVLYAAESLFSLGLRSSADAQVVGEGATRARGPLFGASTGHFILIPALGYALQQLMAKRRVVHAALVLALTVSVFALGSRAALVVLGVFFLLVIAGARSLPHRLLLAAAVVGLLFAAGRAVVPQSSLARLVVLDDAARLTTHRSSFERIAHRDVWEQLLGAGYGGVWAWYLPDRKLGSGTGLYFRMKTTPYGKVLYHSHSLLLLLLVELGLPGLLGGLGLAALLVRLVRRARRGREDYVLCASLAASALSGFMDLFLFKAAALAAVWWLFLFGALRLVHGARASSLSAAEAAWLRGLGGPRWDEAELLRADGGRPEPGELR
jgi:hypothetical protein